MKDLQITHMGLAITSQDLDQFSNEFNLRLPLAYREFIIAHNGGYPRFGAFGNPYEDGTSIQGFSRISLVDEAFEELRGKVDSVRDTIIGLQIEEEVIPKHLYPFGFDAGGNFFCLSMDSKDFGVIYKYFVDGREPEQVFVTDSFEEFINSLEDASIYQEDDY